MTPSVHDEAIGNGIAGAWRPHPNLWRYYLLQSLLLGPLFPLLAVPRYLRYRTLRYRFDERGVSVEWGALFHRQVSLGYSRIQDIHLASNVVERWLGLARIQIQTASGTAGAEMTVEGLLEHEEIRDWLYRRMRESSGPRGRPETKGSDGGDRDEPGDRLAETLEAVAAELRSVRRLLEERFSADEDPGG